jgi:hypothetical protein
LTLPLALLTYGIGRRAARMSGVPHRAAAIRLTLAIAVPYAMAGAAVALFATTKDGSVDPMVAALGAGLLALLAAGSGVFHESGLLLTGWNRIPIRGRAWLRAGGAAAAALITGGALLVVLALGAQAARIGPLTRSLDAGVIGGLLITLLGVVLIPNAVVWATAYALGPGFLVGTGTAVSPGEIRLGPLPGLPLLAGLPTTTPDLIGWLVLMVPVAAGVVAALVLRRAGAALGPWGTLLDSALAGAVAGAVVSALAALSAGSAGPGRLADVGPSPMLTGLAAAVEVTLITAVAGTVLLWRHRNEVP